MSNRFSAFLDPFGRLNVDEFATVNRRVLLRGLAQESVFDLLSVNDPSEEGAPARQALAAALFQETEGNPFFIREVIAHLIESGKLVHENGRWSDG